MLFGLLLCLIPGSGKIPWRSEWQLDSENVDDEETSTGGFVPGLLHSAQDVFSNNTSYTFSIAYFKSRGPSGRGAVLW